MVDASLRRYRRTGAFAAHGSGRADDARPLLSSIISDAPRTADRFVGLGFEVAGGIARDGAPTQGFPPDELEDELIAFRRDLELRFFAT